MNLRDPLLELRKVTKNYDGFELKPLDLSLERGYIMGFIGENGAGKTTTIKSIMNLIQLDGGEILVDGLDSVKHEKAVKGKIGFVFDDMHFYEFLKMDQMTEIIRRFYPRWDQGLYQTYIKRFDLPTNKKIKELSSGMKMKYCLATALSHGAELILLDEPTSGLDPVFRSELLEIFQDLISTGERSIFFSSHITSDLDQVADYISLIHRGQLVFSEDQETIRDRFHLVKGGISQWNPLAEKACYGVRKNEISFSGLTSDVAAVRKHIPGEVVIEPANLEEIMIHIARGGNHA